MKYARAGLGIFLLLICTLASLKVLFFGVYIEEERLLKSVEGELAGIHCKKDRFIISVRLRGDENRYWLEQEPRKLPSCERGKENWVKGSHVKLSHTTGSPNSDFYVYALSINNDQIFTYSDAVDSIKSSTNTVFGFTAALWGFLILAIGVNKYKHNKPLKARQ